MSFSLQSSVRTCAGSQVCSSHQVKEHWRVSHTAQLTSQNETDTKDVLTWRVCSSMSARLGCYRLYTLPSCPSVSIIKTLQNKGRRRWWPMCLRFFPVVLKEMHTHMLSTSYVQKQGCKETNTAGKIWLFSKHIVLHHLHLSRGPLTLTHNLHLRPMLNLQVLSFETSVIKHNLSILLVIIYQ